MPSVGNTIKLISTSDPHAQHLVGQTGMVQLIDALGTIHCQFPDGQLGLIPGQDRWEVISQVEAEVKSTGE